MAKLASSSLCGTNRLDLILGLVRLIDLLRPEGLSSPRRRASATTALTVDDNGDGDIKGLEK